MGGGGCGGSCMYAYVWLWVGADFTAQSQKVYLPLLQKTCSVPSLVSTIMPPFFETIQWRNCTMGETLQWGALHGRKGCTRTMGDYTIGEPGLYSWKNCKFVRWQAL